MTTCYLCNSGYFSQKPQQSDCNLCTIGKFSESGWSTCQICSSGRFSNSPGSSCSLCQIGFFNHHEQKSSCISCPKFSTTSNEGSDPLSFCFCQSGYFGKAFSGSNCTQCATLVGMSCPINSSLPVIQAGYFRDPNNPNSVTECTPRKACMPASAEESSFCTNGYTGFSCGSYVKFQYYKQGFVCTECPGVGARVGNYLLVAFLFFWIIWRASKNGFILLCTLECHLLAVFPRLEGFWILTITTVYTMIISSTFSPFRCKNRHQASTLGSKNLPIYVIKENGFNYTFQWLFFLSYCTRS